MAIKNVLQDAKARLTALLNYANGVTGKNDPSLGDAVKTLCDGYGQGGAGMKTAEITVTVSDNTANLTFEFPHRPLIVYATVAGRVFTGVAKTTDVLAFNGALCFDVRTMSNGNNYAASTAAGVFRGLELYSGGTIALPCYSDAYPFAAGDEFSVTVIYEEE